MGLGESGLNGLTLWEVSSSHDLWKGNAMGEMADYYAQRVDEYGVHIEGDLK